MSLHHGGQLHAAARQFGVPLEQWLDLSTGVSPYSWPVPEVPAAVWRDLPDSDGGLEQAAANYYGCPAQNLLAVDGSQFALATMPGLLPGGRVAMPRRGYAEHRAAWQGSGYKLCDYADIDSLIALVDEGQVEHALVINPNNPTAGRIGKQQLQRLRETLRRRGGYLVVDEAFGDIEPEYSIVDEVGAGGLVVYRSLGKFFGLAGLRLGFLIGESALCRAMCKRMMPWQVSHPARWIGRRALQDEVWQAMQRARLQDEGEQWLAELRAQLPDFDLSGAGLFVTASAAGKRCSDLFQFAARRGLLLRLFQEQDGVELLRFGLPTLADKSRVLDILTAYAGDARCSEAS